MMPKINCLCIINKPSDEPNQSFEFESIAPKRLCLLLLNHSGSQNILERKVHAYKIPMNLER